MRAAVRLLAWALALGIVMFSPLAHAAVCSSQTVVDPSADLPAINDVCTSINGNLVISLRTPGSETNLTFPNLVQITGDLRISIELPGASAVILFPALGTVGGTVAAAVPIPDASLAVLSLEMLSRAGSIELGGAAHRGAIESALFARYTMGLQIQGPLVLSSGTGYLGTVRIENVYEIDAGSDSTASVEVGGQGLIDAIHINEPVMGRSACLLSMGKLLVNLEAGGRLGTLNISRAASLLSAKNSITAPSGSWIGNISIAGGKGAFFEIPGFSITGADDALGHIALTNVGYLDSSVSFPRNSTCLSVNGNIVTMSYQVNWCTHKGFTASPPNTACDCWDDYLGVDCGSLPDDNYVIGNAGPAVDGIYHETKPGNLTKGTVMLIQKVVPTVYGTKYFWVAQSNTRRYMISGMRSVSRSRPPRKGWYSVLPQEAVPKTVITAGGAYMGDRLNEDIMVMTEAEHRMDSSSSSQKGFAIPIASVLVGFIIIALIMLFVFYHQKRTQRGTELSRLKSSMVISSSTSKYQSLAPVRVASPLPLDANGFASIHYAIARGDTSQINQIISGRGDSTYSRVYSPEQRVPLNSSHLITANSPPEHTLTFIGAPLPTKGHYDIPGDLLRPMKRDRLDIQVEKHSPDFMEDSPLDHSPLSLRRTGPPASELEPVVELLSEGNHFKTFPSADSPLSSPSSSAMEVDSSDAYSPSSMGAVAIRTGNEADIANTPDAGGNSPVAWAVRLGNLTALKTLIEWGANVNLPNSKLQSPLHVACINNPDPLIVKALLNAGANVDAADSDCMTPLLYCCSLGSVQLLDMLYRMQADVNVADSQGTTGLMLAASRGHKAVVDSLLKCPTINPNQQDKRGWTALHWAAAAGDVACVHSLVNCEAVILPQKNLAGETALHLAVREDSQDVVLELLGGKKVAQLLLLALAKTELGLSARDYAIKYSHPECAQLLLDLEKRLSAQWEAERGTRSSPFHQGPLTAEVVRSSPELKQPAASFTTDSSSHGSGSELDSHTAIAMEDVVSERPSKSASAPPRGKTQGSSVSSKRRLDSESSAPDFPDNVSTASFGTSNGEDGEFRKNRWPSRASYMRQRRAMQKSEAEDTMEKMDKLEKENARLLEAIQRERAEAERLRLLVYGPSSGAKQQAQQQQPIYQQTHKLQQPAASSLHTIVSLDGVPVSSSPV